MALESNGMVRRYPGRGCFVSEITVQDLNEIFDLRTILETAALQRSYQFLKDFELEQLEHDLQALTVDSPVEAYFDTDRRLHELLVGNCGNIRLLWILRTLNGQIEQMRQISARQPLRLAASRVEHLEIVSSLRRKDLSQSCQLLANHIRNVQKSTLSVCMQMGIR